MIDQKKKEIRKLIRDKKKEYSLDEKKIKSARIFAQLEQYQWFNDAKIIMAYWSMDDEVHTHNFLEKYLGKKKIILPVVNGDVLDLKEFTGVTDLTEGEHFKIGEPTGNDFTEIEKIDLIITPGVAFDKERNRLGRGKAYYDKLLKTTKAVKVGVCFDFQLLDSVPVDEHDVKMDYVLTD